jgi:hypothetical protein
MDKFFAKWLKQDKTGKKFNEKYYQQDKENYKQYLPLQVV